MTSITDIFEDVTKSVSAKLGCNVNFLFGDWSYISSVLSKWSSSRDTANSKYPAICLLSPFSENRDLPGKKADASLEFIIVTDTLANYTNEQRRELSFKKKLNPIYEEFLNQIKKHKRLDPGYNPSVPHQYTENYRYGRIGVLDADGKDFKDRIDAIEIKDLKITIKK